VAETLGLELPFRVFLFTTADKLVVTDIDGTITENEVPPTMANHFLKGQ
jgi:phosphatidate phosphatase PAH1